MGELFVKSIKSIVCILILSIFVTGCGEEKDTSSIKVEQLKVNHQTNPMAIDDNISFSWQMLSDEPEQYQNAYRLVVANSEKNIKKGKFVWDSGKVETSESINIPYEGDSLLPGEKYFWQVKVWDKNDNYSTSKETAFFMTGLDESSWSGAEWVCVENPTKNQTANTSFTINYDYRTDIPSYSGMMFGVEHKNYGKYTTCIVDSQAEEVIIKVCQMDGEKVLSETSSILSDKGVDVTSFIGSNHHINLVCSADELSVYCDEKYILSSPLLEKVDTSVIGLFTSRGEAYDYYDNIVIADNNDNVVFEENFENERNIFYPYYTKIVDGWIEASSGYIFTPGSEIPAPMLRREFETKKQIKSAILYASALGIYDISINGEKINDEFFGPGHSNYNKEAYYRAYDVTSMINEGSNALGVMLGAGRYNKAGNHFGDTVAFKCKLNLIYDNDEVEYVVSDVSWLGYNNGPIRSEDMFYGEYYDSDFEAAGWNKPYFDASKWSNVSVLKLPDIEMVASDTNSIRCIQKITPVSVTEPKKGTYVYDMGQNINGFAKIDIDVPKGQRVVLRYAEMLNEENLLSKDDVVGTIWTRNLFTADNTDIYISSGAQNETYMPTFVCRGFRYVQITGINEALPLESVTGMVMTTDNERTGYFECSDDSINRLYESIYWSQIDNYMDIPTDCPQRDERYGWAGDAQVFTSTASYNSDVYQFLRQYVNMLREEQSHEGWYPQIAGRVSSAGGSNGWSDAGVIIPWELYKKYGDKEIIYENLDAMCRYVDYLVSTSDNYVRYHQGYKDYNSINGIDDDICNTAQCAYVADILSRMCTATGENDKAVKYREVYENYKKAWQRFIGENGAIDQWQQSAFVLALAFNLYPEGLKEEGAKLLDTTIAYSDYHMNTGYVTTPFLLPVLSDNGYSKTAYRLIRQDTHPSLKYMLNHGSTTITEGWNTYIDNEDGTFNINGSLNHYSLGSVSRWLYEYVLGIKADENNPGFKHFYLAPVIDTDLSYAQGRFETIYGSIESSWEIIGNEVIYHFVIPANTSATLMLPVEEYNNVELLSGEYEYRVKLF